MAVITAGNIKLQQPEAVCRRKPNFMLAADKIQEYLSLFPGLTVTDVMQLIALARPVQLQAGETYIKEGARFRKLAYIQKGLMRGVFIKENGTEVTVSLRWEDQIIASHDNIIYDRASRFTYYTLENTVLLEIDYDTVNNFILQHPGFEKGRIYFWHRMMADMLERLEGFVLFSPEERYLELIRSKPGIVNRVPDKFIASFLGITPVSLSRIRKRIAGKH
ncbi:Crp/Fnr family transcriptional regulator [Chitinophagaceae bacterium MMS25-I14]